MAAGPWPVIASDGWSGSPSRQSDAERRPGTAAAALHAAARRPGKESANAARASPYVARAVAEPGLAPQAALTISRPKVRTQGCEPGATAATVRRHSHPDKTQKAQELCGVPAAGCDGWCELRTRNRGLVASDLSRASAPVPVFGQGGPAVSKA